LKDPDLGQLGLPGLLELALPPLGVGQRRVDALHRAFLHGVGLGAVTRQALPGLLERGLLRLQRHQRIGPGGELHLHPGARGVEQVHRLVRQLPAGEVALAELHRGHHRLVADGDPV